MDDCYRPPSFDFLAPAPNHDPKATTPEFVLEQLTAGARDALRRMLEGNLPFSSLIYQSGVFVRHRRVVRVGMPFVILNANLIETPRAEALRSVGRQMCAVWN